jgi:copper chaperone NosL
MRGFKFLFFTLILLYTSFINGCSSSEGASSKTAEHDNKSCPKCNMHLPSSNIHTAKIQLSKNNLSFDDIGCLILWAKDKNLDIESTEVFSNDTHKYISVIGAYFTINEKTPMNYGFSAYENFKENTIKIDEVKLRMLRGEHMANPKIRKQILGQ